MPEVLCIQCFKEPFIQPINLSKYPNDISANASAQWKGKLLICHKAAKQVYDTYKAVIQSLHNQFHEAIYEEYLTELNRSYISLTNIHPSKIYQHFVD